MKKLDKVGDLVIKLDGDLDRLREYGFRRVYKSSASGKIFIHDKKRIVVKQSYLVGRAVPVLAAPTKFVVVKNRKILVQVLVNRVNVRLAFVRLIDLGYDKQDHKAANCGWYRGKPVVIDW